MIIPEQINQMDFLQVAQYSAPVDGTDVYFYVLDNTNINVRKTAANDFETWVVVYNHFDGVTLILTGAAPVANAERYTLVQHLENVAKPEPVVMPQEPVQE